MAFSFKVLGVNRVRNSLRRLASLEKEVIDPVGYRWAQDTRAKLKSTRYPPKRPNQQYIRTGQLANRWAVKRDRPGQWTISNEAQRKGRFYAPYVIGDNQAWMHVGRWWKAKDIIREEIPKLTKALSEKIENIFDG